MQLGPQLAGQGKKLHAAIAARRVSAFAQSADVGKVRSSRITSPRKSKIMSYRATKESGTEPARRSCYNKAHDLEHVFIRLLRWASHERASALRPETAHCRSLISHSRPAVSVS